MEQMHSISLNVSVKFEHPKNGKSRELKVNRFL